MRGRQMLRVFFFAVSTTFRRRSEWARAQLVPWVALMYANWMPSNLTLPQLTNPCWLETSIPRGPKGPAAGAASESPSGVGAPETTRGRDKMDRARIWRRDRMVQRCWRNTRHGLQFMQNPSPPSHVHRVVIANITEITMELTNTSLYSTPR